MLFGLCQLENGVSQAFWSGLLDLGPAVPQQIGDLSDLQASFSARP